MRSGQFLTSGI